MGKLAMELMYNMIKPLCVTFKTYIMDISLCVLKGSFGMIDIGIYGRLLVKKFRNWKTGIHRYEINAHSLRKIENYYLSGHWKGVNFDISVVKNKNTIL